MTALDSPVASGALAAVPAQARGLLAEGRKRGFLTSDQISDALQELPLNGRAARSETSSAGSAAKASGSSKATSR